MKKIFTLVLFFFFFVSFSNQASAKILTSKDGDINIAKNETINDDLLIGAKNTNIDGVINGDVFVGAESVTITGNINGNLHVGSKSLILKGNVKGNVYIGAANISIIGSKIDGSLLFGAGTANIDKDTTISGSIFAGVGDLNIDSKISRNLYIGSRNAKVLENTKIGKDFYYAVDDKNNGVSISEKAIILGEIHKNVYQTPQKTSVQDSKKQFATFKSIISLSSFISALLIGLLYFKLFKKHFISSSEIVSNQFWKSLGIGFLIILTIVPAVIILLLTIVGIPLIGVLFLLISLFGFLSKFIVSMAVGNFLSNKFKWNLKESYWIFSLGLVIIYIVKSIPVFGGFVSCIVWLVGLGALVLNLFARNK